MTNANNFQIGQEVTFNNAYGVNVITAINGKSATTLEKNTGLTYTKRLTSLKPYVQQKAYWSEQDLATPIHRHGDTVYTMLCASGNGKKVLWDDNQKKCVEANALI